MTHIMQLAGAHQSLAYGSVHVYHTILHEVLTELHQQLLGAFGHLSSQRMPESNQGLGLHQIDVINKYWTIFCHA